MSLALPALAAGTARVDGHRDFVQGDVEDSPSSRRPAGCVRAGVDELERQLAALATLRELLGGAP